MFRNSVLFCLCFFSPFSGVSGENIKKADFAGTWYPDDPILLRQRINGYFEKIDIPDVKEDIVAVICPHAGINYSGATAAASFSAAKDKKVDTVILIGFSHKMNYDGIAVFDKDGIETPLGIIHSNKEWTQKVASESKKIFHYPSAFREENSIELILPFIQTTFKDAKVVLLAIGNQSLENAEILGGALYEVLRDENDFLIVASTDMSHYLLYAEAEKMDISTADLVLKMEPQELFLRCYNQNRMCGTGAVVSAMIAAKKLGADKAVILRRSTSAEVTGDKGRTVGYLSAALINGSSKRVRERSGMDIILNDDQKLKIIQLARETIVNYLRNKEISDIDIDDETLEQVMGVFVTLRKGHNLRGCIGNIIGTKPLYKGVVDMAIAASTQDPRFKSVSIEELDDIKIEISVLSPLQKIINPDEIILGKHGVLVKDSFRSGVYLPQVATETGWNKKEFMNSLCSQKAGIRPDAWEKGECEIYVFTAEIFGE